MDEGGFVYIACTVLARALEKSQPVIQICSPLINIGYYQEGPRGDHFVVKVVDFHNFIAFLCILIFEPISIISFFIETLACTAVCAF